MRELQSRYFSTSCIDHLKDVITRDYREGHNVRIDEIISDLQSIVDHLLKYKKVNGRSIQNVSQAYNAILDKLNTKNSIALSKATGSSLRTRFNFNAYTQAIELLFSFVRDEQLFANDKREVTLLFERYNKEWKKLAKTTDRLEDGNYKRNPIELCFHIRQGHIVAATHLSHLDCLDIDMVDMNNLSQYKYKDMVDAACRRMVEAYAEYIYVGLGTNAFVPERSLLDSLIHFIRDFNGTTAWTMPPRMNLKNSIIILLKNEAEKANREQVLREIYFTLMTLVDILAEYKSYDVQDREIMQIIWDLLSVDQAIVLRTYLGPTKEKLSQFYGAVIGGKLKRSSKSSMKKQK